VEEEKVEKKRPLISKKSIIQKDGRNYSNGFCLYSAVAGALSFFGKVL
jgi:hypothetical protein